MPQDSSAAPVGEAESTASSSAVSAGAHDHVPMQLEGEAGREGRTTPASSNLDPAQVQPSHPTSSSPLGASTSHQQEPHGAVADSCNVEQGGIAGSAPDHPAAAASPDNHDTSMNVQLRARNTRGGWFMIVDRD